MKSCYRFAAFYAVIALIGGVFYREFTKFNGSTGTTALGVVHTHAFILGMFFFLILLILEYQFQISNSRRFSLFIALYNAGLLLTIIMLAVRGTLQVLGTELSTGMDASISGIAGIGHILLGIGLLFFFLSLKDRIRLD